MSSYCAISKAVVVEPGLLYSGSDYGYYLHRTRVGLNLIYRSDGGVERDSLRASASGLVDSGIRFRVRSNQ